jgi:hypothetical protein
MQVRVTPTLTPNPNPMDIFSMIPLTLTLTPTSNPTLTLTHLSLLHAGLIVPWGSLHVGAEKERHKEIADVPTQVRIQTSQGHLDLAE